MSNTAKVGAFMVVALVTFAYLIFKVEDVRWWGDDAQWVEVRFDSVAGLDDKAAVRVAGVRVGRVDGIRLIDDRALVRLVLDTPVELREGASATIASLGLLGDKFVELEPGAPGGRPVSQGAILEGVTPIAWDDAVAQLSDLGASLQGALGGFDERSTGASVGRLLDNLEAASATTRELLAANRDRVGSTVSNFETLSAVLAAELPRLTRQMESILAQVESVVAENRGTLRGTLEHVAEVSDRMRGSIDNLNAITDKIAAGEGSLGKLVASEEAHDQLTATLGAVEEGVSSLGEAFGRIQETRFELNFDGYLLEKTDRTRTAFSLTLDPETSNRFYHLGGVDDPRGRQRTRTEVVTVVGSDGEAETTTTTTRTREDKIALSAQFGFRLGDARLRAGLFESTGGAALDYDLFAQRLRVSLEAFDFNRDDTLDPHLRVTGTWRLSPNVYLLGGYDDLLETDLKSAFAGAGVRWTDDDLKYLLGALPSGF